MVNWTKGKVTKIQFWTDVLFSLFIRASIYPFIAGQFTKLGIEINGERIQRAYSYVNAPNNPNLEFYLVNIPEGKLSSHLSTLKPGDEIYISRKASGFFVLNEVPSCETLWMLATGTAIGPYISILEHGEGTDRFKNIVLVHAVRYFADLSYFSHMLTLQKRYKGKLHIQSIVSRETVIGSLRGRIPSLIENRALENAVGLPINAKTSHVMLCGNPQMVRDTQKLLKETRRMNKHLRHYPGHVTIERYW